MVWIEKGMRYFFSYGVVLLLLAILGIGAGVATFIESAYDTQSAKIAVYDAAWYETVMVLSCLCMIGLMYKTRMWRRKGAFFIHAAFVVILIGAGLTRYFGYEGVMHVREGKSENEMLTVTSYLHVETPKASFEYPLALTQLGSNEFTFKETIEGKPLVVTYKNYRYKAKGELATLWVDVRYGSEMRSVKIEGGAGWIEEPVTVSFQGLDVHLSWGSKVLVLPFSIALRDFQLERYPGSMSASSYASEIDVLDTLKKPVMAYRIFMNHPLHYEGYTFFQSSYDTDEKGTVLEINKDPGKWPTYAGYFLLTAGFLMNFFTRGSRFFKLRAYLKNAQLVWIALFVSFLGVDVRANTADYSAYLEQVRVNSAVHADKDLSELLVQDMQGRMKPFSTEATEIVTKLTTQRSLYGLSAEQMVLAMSTRPDIWQDIAIVKLSNRQIKTLIGMKEDQEYASFSQVFDESGRYKLAQAMNDANQKAQSKRGTFENDLIKFDEKLNIAYLTFKGVLFKFIPLPNDPAHTWVDPSGALTHPSVSSEVKTLISNYFAGLQEGIETNRWEKATQALYGLKAHQRAEASEILPSATRVKAEVTYNRLGLFQKLVGFYFIVGLWAFALALVYLFRGQRLIVLEKATIVLFALGFGVHTFALALRWYVSAHAPWSDSYESMIYIGWSAALAGLVVFRRSILSLSSAAILAAIVMLVAHMSFVNPQITNLVPVLKSYWLSIHVSVITASYGFLGLGALLGAVSLVLMALKRTSNEERINEQIRMIGAINEISLIIGLSMLSVGNFFGGIWANESWGRYWGWDPKETWSYVSIIVYALILHLRFVPKLSSLYVFSIASIVGFGSILMTYFGVNFYLTGMHSYAASGESPAIPSGVYYVLAIIVCLAFAAYRGRKVRLV